jgi:hypothetical protein
MAKLARTCLQGESLSETETNAAAGEDGASGMKKHLLHKFVKWQCNEWDITCLPSGIWALVLAAACFLPSALGCGAPTRAGRR